MDSGGPTMFPDSEGRGDLHALYERVVELTGDGVYRLDDEGRVRAVDENLLEKLGRARKNVIGTDATDYVAEEDAAALTEAIEGVLTGDLEEPVAREVTLQRADGGERACEIRLGTLTNDGEFLGTVGIVREIERRKRQERAIESQRDRLARLDRINRVVRDIDRALVQSRTRRDVESALCDRLTRSDTYRYAWLGACGPEGGGSATVRDAGSIPDDFLREPGEREPCDGCPIQRAERTGVVQVGQPADCGLVRPDVRERYGVSTMACVPLQYEGRQYGVLSIYAQDEDAFGWRERSVLGELGSTVGNAIHATELRQALVSDSFVEVTVKSRSTALYPVALSVAADARVEWEGAVPRDDGSIRYYLTVEDDDPELADEVAREVPRVESVTVISAFDDAYVLEVALGDQAFMEALSPVGGQLTDLTVTDGVARAVLEFPRTGCVREGIDRLSAVVEDVEVVSQRDVTRQRQTSRQFRATIADELTDRQRTVLWTAYYSGLFEWPRACTGEELADRLDIAPATFHYHLRKAEETIIGAAIGDAGEAVDGGD